MGIIPEDWEVKRFGEISSQLSNYSFTRAEMTNVTQEIRYIHYGDIHIQPDKDFIDMKVDNLPFIYDELLIKTIKSKVNLPFLVNGDVIYADASEDYEGIGNCWEIIETKNYKIVSGLHTIAVRFLKNAVFTGFGRYLFKNHQSAKSLRIMAHGTKVYSLNYANVSKLHVSLPPLPEQKKIAKILSVWDVAIEKQTLLIEKLELRKRALMQQLLTGKKRLKGFRDEWEKVKLGEICAITTGKVDANAMSVNGIYPFFTCAREVYKINQFQFDTEALLISGNGEYVGYVQYCKGKFNAYQRTYVLDKFSEDIFFIKYSLQYKLPKRIIETKSSSNTPYIVMSSLVDMYLFIPYKEEQVAIAEILYTADKEIEIAKEILYQLKKQKKGLMQILLTGKKRVITTTNTQTNENIRNQKSIRAV